MIAALLLATIPMDLVARDRVDLIERNTVYDDDGNQTLQQFIFWDWQGQGHRVVAWRLAADKSWNPPVLRWVENGRPRAVQCNYWQETHYQWDEEIRQREIVPECERRGLSR